MASENDPSLLAKFVDYAWAGVLGLMGLLFKKHNEEMSALKASIAEVKDEVSDKASSVEVTQQRGDIVELFHSQVDIRREMANNHKEVMNAVSVIATQVATIVGRMHK